MNSGADVAHGFLGRIEHTAAQRDITEVIGFALGLGAQQEGNRLANARGLGTIAALVRQHPGEGGTFEEPAVRWPDPEGPARPALVVFQKDDGGVIGT